MNVYCAVKNSGADSVDWEQTESKVVKDLRKIAKQEGSEYGTFHEAMELALNYNRLLIMYMHLEPDGISELFRLRPSMGQNSRPPLRLLYSTEEERAVLFPNKRHLLFGPQRVCFV